VVKVVLPVAEHLDVNIQVAGRDLSVAKAKILGEG
jgi:hypothetical protein